MPLAYVTFPVRFPVKPVLAVMVVPTIVLAVVAPMVVASIEPLLTSTVANVAVPEVWLILPVVTVPVKEDVVDTLKASM